MRFSIVASLFLSLMVMQAGTGDHQEQQLLALRLKNVQVLHGGQQTILVDLVLKNNADTPFRIPAPGTGKLSFQIEDANGKNVRMTLAPLLVAPENDTELTVDSGAEHVVRCELRSRHSTCPNLGHTFFLPEGVSPFPDAATREVVWKYPIKLTAQLEGPGEDRQPLLSPAIEIADAEE